MKKALFVLALLVPVFIYIHTGADNLERGRADLKTAAVLHGKPRSKKPKPRYASNIKAREFLAVMMNDDVSESLQITAALDLANLDEIPPDSVLAILKVINDYDTDYFPNRGLIFEDEETMDTDEETVDTGMIAKQILIKMGKSAVAPLLEIMLDNTCELRGDAVLALGLLGENASEAIPALYEYFDTRLRKVDETGDYELSGSCILDDDSEIEIDTSIDASDILFVLGKMGDGAVPYLLKALDYNDLECEEALARFGTKALPGLIDALESGSPDLWIGAAGTLALMGENASEAAEPLGRLLLDEREDIVIKVLEALVQMKRGALPALPYVISALEQKKCRISGYLAEIIKNLGSDAADAAPLLMENVKESDFCFCGDGWGYANALVAIGKKAVPVLRKGLKSDDWYRRMCALEAIESMGENAIEFLPDLIKYLEIASGWDKRSLPSIFKRIGGDSIPYLIEALNSKNPKVRDMAAVSLSEFKEEAVANVFEDAFRDNSADVRCSVLFASYNTETGRCLCIRALDDPDPCTRLYAARLLIDRDVEKEKVKEVILSGLSGNANERYSMAYTLAHCDGKNADSDYISPLCKLFSDEDDNIRCYALNALGKYGSRAAGTIDTVYPLVLDNSNEVRQAAAGTLQRMDDLHGEAIRMLVESFRFGQSFQDQDMVAETNSITTIVKQGEKAIPYLEEALESENQNIRECAKIALEYIKKKYEAKGK